MILGALLSVFAASFPLTWTPPTHNTDGTVLTDLEAYGIYWDCGGGEVSDLALAPATGYTVESLPDGGVCEFTVTAINSGGVESARSGVLVHEFTDVPAAPAEGPNITWSDEPESVAVAFRSAATATTSLTVNKPAGAVEGDICVFAIKQDSGTNPSHANWTQIYNATEGFGELGVLYRVLTGTEPASWTFSGNTSQQSTAAIVCYSGVDTADPFAGTSVGAVDTGSNTAFVGPSMTTDEANAMVVRIYANADGSGGSMTPPTGFDERVDMASPNGFQSLMICDDIQVSAGATGTADATNSGSDQSFGVVIALNPAAAGGTAISAGLDTLAISEQAADIDLDVDIATSLDTLVITENAASVGLGKSIAAAVHALSITEFPATLTLDVDIEAAVDALTITEFASAISTGKTIRAAADSLGLTVFASNIALDVPIAAGFDALTISELQATVDLVQGTEIQAGTDSLTITELRATIFGGEITADGKVRGMILRIGRMMG